MEQQNTTILDEDNHGVLMMANAKQPTKCTKKHQDKTLCSSRLG
jgi:hypothetical protein